MMNQKLNVGTTGTNESDEVLWNLYRSGNNEALAIIYQRHIKKMYAYGRKFNRDEEIVKDSLQDLFSELLSKTVSETASVKNYLLKSLRRKLMAVSNRPVFYPMADDYDFHFVPSVEDQWIDSQINKESATKVRKAIEQLTKRQQEIIYLKFYQDMDNESIAEIMSLSYQSVCNLISRAVKMIREILANQHIPLLYLIFLISQ